ncbi:hypothetical protein HZS_1815 [Henneguya salminicola]|nr:hypothetical protein HZS_1815 [Henneguya salminicola]
MLCITKYFKNRKANHLHPTDSRLHHSLVGSLTDLIRNYEEDSSKLKAIELKLVELHSTFLHSQHLIKDNHNLLKEIFIFIEKLEQEYFGFISKKFDDSLFCALNICNMIIKIHTDFNIHCVFNQRISVLKIINIIMTHLTSSEIYQKGFGQFSNIVIDSYNKVNIFIKNTLITDELSNLIIKIAINGSKFCILRHTFNIIIDLISKLCIDLNNNGQRLISYLMHLTNIETPSIRLKQKNDFFIFLVKFTEDSIVMCRSIKHPSAILSLLSLNNFTLKILKRNDINQSIQCISIDILAKMILYYEKIKKKSNFVIYPNKFDYSNNNNNISSFCIIFSYIYKKYGHKHKFHTRFDPYCFLLVFLIRGENINSSGTSFKFVDNLFEAIKKGSYENINEMCPSSDKNIIHHALNTSTKNFFDKCEFESAFPFITSLTNSKCISIRIKSLKSVYKIVRRSPDVFETSDIFPLIEARLYDRSSLVRKASIEIFGSLIQNDVEKSDKYLEILIERIIDTSVLVRRRVVQNLYDILISLNTRIEKNQILLKMIKRIEDVSSIVKIVVASFRHLWSVEKDEDVETVSNSILYISLKLGEESTELFSKLFKLIESFYKKDINFNFFLGIKKIIDHLFKIFLDGFHSQSSVSESAGNVISCLSKLFPSFFYNYVPVLTDIIKTHSVSNESMEILFQYVCRTYSTILPSLQSYDTSNFSNLEENLIRVILQHTTSLNEAICCLKIILLKNNKDYRLVVDLFQQYIKYLQNEHDKNDTRSISNNNVSRILYTLSGILRHFQIKDIFIKDENIPHLSIKQIANLFLKYTNCSDKDVKLKAFMSLTNLLQYYPKYFLDLWYKESFNKALGHDTDEPIKICILKSFAYLLRSIELRFELKTTENEHQLSEISNVIQAYFNVIQNAYNSKCEAIRLNIYFIVKISIKLGLIPPQRYTPFVIIMTLDPKYDIQKQAVLLIKSINKKYPNSIDNSFKQSLKLSYGFYQKISDTNMFSSFISKSCSYSFFEHIYPFILSTKQRKHKFLEHIFFYMSMSNPHYDLNLIVFCALSLAYLPFKSYSDLIYLIQQIEISMGLLEDADLTKESAHSNTDTIIILFQILLLIKLRQYLLRAYDINSDEINFDSPSTQRLSRLAIPEKKKKLFLDISFYKKFQDSSKINMDNLKIVLLKELNKEDKTIHLFDDITNNHT